jgi:hypothetical protein
MKFVATKTADQLDLQALHRVRERLVSQRTSIINQIRAFLLERGIAERQGLRFLRAELPGILAKRTDVLPPRMLRIIEDLSGDWRRLDERIENLSGEIVALACQDKGCERLMTIPGIGPLISSAIVAAIGTGDPFSKGRDFGAWLETNACSPLATNAIKDKIWNDFSSNSYKELPPVGTITVHHPYSGAPRPYAMPGGGRGYTRPASLISLWSTAAYLRADPGRAARPTVHLLFPKPALLPKARGYVRARSKARVHLGR